MNTKFIIATTLLVVYCVSPTNSANASIAENAQLTVTHLSSQSKKIGVGKYQARLDGAGVIVRQGKSASTSFDLTCEIDDLAATLDCTGSLALSNKFVPIQLNASDVNVRSALRKGSPPAFETAFERWNLEVFTEIAPFDLGQHNDGNEGDSESGDDSGGFDPPILIWETDDWIGRDWYYENWTYIIDGIVFEPIW